MVTEAFLQAPSFLYRLETAGKKVWRIKAIALDNYEVASRLSYLLTDSMPDADLMSVAHAGKLATVAGLEEQARRLLKSDQARQAVASAAPSALHETVFSVCVVTEYIPSTLAAESPPPQDIAPKNGRLSAAYSQVRK